MDTTPYNLQHTSAGLSAAADPRPCQEGGSSHCLHWGETSHDFQAERNFDVALILH